MVAAMSRIVALTFLVLLLPTPIQSLEISSSTRPPNRPFQRASVTTLAPPILLNYGGGGPTRRQTQISSQGSSRRQMREQQQSSSSWTAEKSWTATSLFMSVEGDFDPHVLSKAKQDVEAGSIKARLRALYKFTRPHTIRGTILASIAGTTRALLDTPGALAGANWSLMLPRAAVGMVALLLGNAFIVGINQIYDKEIDEMNKPFLPVASGEMSKRAAWVTVLTSGIVGPILVKKLFPPLLFRLYSLGLVLGGIYSVPPIRTKKNPLLAGLTIATVRGFLLNFGVYYAVKDAIGAPFMWSPKVSFVARFMTIFATVIAVTKDLPDVEGDKVRIV